MSGKLLDMRQWALASLDKSEAMLRHKDGHEMRVSIQHLPKLQQEQIKRIKKADGGPVLDPEKTKQFEQGMNPSKKPQPQPEPPKPAPQMYAEGEEVKKRDEGLNAEELKTARDLGDTRDYDKSDTGLFTPAQEQRDNTPPQLADDQQQQPTVVIHNHAAPQQPNVPQVPAAAITSSASQPQTASAPEPAQPQPFSSEQAAQEQVGATQKFGQERQKAQQDIETNLTDMSKHTDDFANWMQAHPINPRAYQESQSTGQKVNTAIGLLLGGLGGMGKGNAALDFLNRQIDRDIDSQKSNMEREKNIYGAYQHLYENSVVSSNLARVTQLDIYDNKMRLAALKIGTPQALSNYQDFHQMAQAQKGHALQTAAAAKSQEGEGQTYEPSPMLKPGQDISQAQFNPKLKPYLPELTSQFTAAQKADRLLGQLPSIFEEMQVGRGPGHLGAEWAKHIPLVGGALESAIEAKSKPAQKYATAKSRLLAEIGNAVGNNVTGSQIQEIVDKNSLTENDQPEDIKRKMKNVEFFVKNAVPRSLLQSGNMLNPEK